MKIDYIEAHPHPGNKTKMVIVIDTNINEVSKNLSNWRFKPHFLEIKPEKHSRSLTANKYYQVLLDKLSGVMNIPRDELHEMMLQRYGVTKKVDGVPVIISLRSDIDGHQASKYVEAIGTGYVNGKEFTHWRILKGSSEMDSKEFSYLLDGLIQDCREQNIETLTDKEIKELKYERI